MGGFQLLHVKKPINQVSENFASIHGLPYKKETFHVRREMNVRVPTCGDFGLHAQVLLLSSLTSGGGPEGDGGQDCSHPAQRLPDFPNTHAPPNTRAPHRRW